MFTKANVTPAALEAKTQGAFETVDTARAVRKGNALSTFRATVAELRSINEDLDESIEVCNKAISFYMAKREAAVKEKSDNEAVAKHIVDIIGE